MAAHGSEDGTLEQRLRMVEDRLEIYNLIATYPPSADTGESSMPFDFEKLTKFRLARGMHKQPNKDGNICVNEAAVIVAGFEYRAVKDVSCLPECFSRPISDYAIYLNDLMLYRMRNEFLAPFVTRLPGTSDSPRIEAERAEFIVIETTRRIIAAEYEEVWYKPAVAAKCRAVRSLRQVSSVMAKAKAVLPLGCAREVLHASRRCLLYRDFRIGAPCAAAAKAAARSFRNKLGPDMDRKIWEMTIAILDEAILLGRHDGIDDHAVAVERLERAKATPVPAQG